MADQPKPPTPEQMAIFALILKKIGELGEDVEPVFPVEEGPRITAYRVRPVRATRIAKVEAMSVDLATALRVDVVLAKRMPGEGVVAITVPRSNPEHLRWQTLLTKGYALLQRARVPLLFGLDWLGRPYVDDLTELPHLLIAGSTGGGKSVFQRSLIATVVQYMNSDAVQLVLSDTKGVEFGDFDKTPHLRWERATSPLRTIEYMDWLCKETDVRLAQYAHAGVRNINEYNRLEIGKVPYIVLVIDELADVVYLPDGKRGAQYIGAEKLDYITRKSRAAGIHVIAAVQRPSVDVVKGVIKNNFPARVSFKMGSAVDSRVILDESGAEQLLEKGDMLYKNGSRILRLHSGDASANDIRGVLEYAMLYKNQNHQLGGIQ
jgi:S-DNA-T family DNA segregation ATPase FtsK/SpoIIIE